MKADFFKDPLFRDGVFLSDELFAVSPTEIRARTAGKKSLDALFRKKFSSILLMEISYGK